MKKEGVGTFFLVDWTGLNFRYSALKPRSPSFPEGLSEPLGWECIFIIKKYPFPFISLRIYELDISSPPPCDEDISL